MIILENKIIINIIIILVIFILEDMKNIINMNIFLINYMNILKS